MPLERRLEFQPGQWVSLHLPVGDEPPLMRAYTMAEPQAEDGRLVLVFDKVPQGRGSGYLYGVRQGDELALAGPYGNFTAAQPDKELLLVARFTGIVPMRCIVKDLLARHAAAAVTLIYCAAQQQNFIYHDEFAQLAERAAAFHYAPILTGGDEYVWQEPAQVIEAVRSRFAERRDYLPMICGIKAFTSALRAYFRELGFDRKAMKVEWFD